MLRLRLYKRVSGFTSFLQEIVRIGIAVGCVESNSNLSSFVVPAVEAIDWSQRDGVVVAVVSLSLVIAILSEG
jgi:hypothetical protein